jgi:hypothetical protein
MKDYLSGKPVGDSRLYRVLAKVPPLAWVARKTKLTRLLGDRQLGRLTRDLEKAITEWNFYQGENYQLNEPAYYFPVYDPENGFDLIREKRPFKRDETLPRLSPTEGHLLRKKMGQSVLGKILLDHTEGRGPTTKVEGKLWEDLVASYETLVATGHQPIDDSYLTRKAMRIVWSCPPLWFRDGVESPWVILDNGSTWEAEHYDKRFTEAIHPNREELSARYRPQIRIQEERIKRGLWDIHV